jgi:hypothetical protein
MSAAGEVATSLLDLVLCCQICYMVFENWQYLNYADGWTKFLHKEVSSESEEEVATQKSEQ